MTALGHDLAAIADQIDEHLLENYFLPGDLEQQVGRFVRHYNHERYHESLNNVTPADVYFGQAQTIINRQERIKLKTIETRRLQYRICVYAPISWSRHRLRP